MPSIGTKRTLNLFKSFFSGHQMISRYDSPSRTIWNSCFVMALSEFEIIVGGLTSIPVVAGIFFLIEKTYGSRNYLRKPVKASPAPKSTAPKPAASKASTSKASTSKAVASKTAASKQQDGSSVKPPSTKTPSAKPKTSISTKNSAAPTPASAPDQVESIQSTVSTPAEKNSENSTDTSS